MADKPLRAAFLEEVHRRLGGGLVRIELTSEHYEDALNFALLTYRQRSANSLEERYAYLELQPDQAEYFLPTEVIEVRQIFRRGMGTTLGSGGAEFNPFAAQVTNQTLLGGSSGSSSLPSLVTYELFAGFRELVGKMFGFHVLFSWNPSTKRLEIARRPRATETVMLWIYTYRSDDSLIQDMYARQWLIRYTTAQCKMILAEARGKFAQLAGPQGGTTLNADTLMVAAQTEIEALHLELSNQVDQDLGYGFIIG